MADDSERLIAIFEARLNDFERNMKRAPGIARQSRVQIEREADQLTRNVEAKMKKAGGVFGNPLAAARGALGIAGIGLGAGAIVNLTSEWSDLNSRVNNAVGSMSRGAEVMGRISEMARRSYSSLTQTADSFIRNADALTELGVSTSRQLDMTEALNNAMVISATRGQQAEAVHRAWTNALALGELRGQNLNTVIQGSTRLTKALADSMGVSTNELRKLGAEGKITSQSMVGVSRELETLRAEADAMPATMTDSFVLLGNAVMQFVGQFDQATGVTSFLAGEIIALADSIEESANRWKDRDVPILQFIDAAAELSRELGILREEIEDTRSDIERVDDSVAVARLAFADLADQMAINENMRAFSPDLVDDIQAVVDKLLLNEMSAEDARDALLALGQQNLDFSSQIGQLAALAGQLRTVTSEANAMHAALNTTGGPTGDGAGRGGAGASRRAAIERQLALDSYTSERERILGLSRDQLALEQAIAREIKDAAAAGVHISAAEAERLARLQLAQREANKGGGGRGANAYADATKSIEDRIFAMQREMEITRQTASAIDDYGYAVARTKAQLELENAAAKEGIALTAERVAQIDQLADGYGRMVAAIEKQTAALELSRDATEELGRVGRNTLDTIIDGFLASKDAGELLHTVLRDVARQLITIGLDQLSGGMKLGGFNPLGFLGSILGFASGTANTGGRRGEPRGVVHGQEAVIPLPNGGRVPVDIRAPSIQSAAPSAPQELRVHIVSDDEKFSAYVTDKAGQVVAQASPAIVATAVGRSNKSAPAAVAMHQRQRGGSDFRTM